MRCIELIKPIYFLSCMLPIAARIFFYIEPYVNNLISSTIPRANHRISLSLYTPPRGYSIDNLTSSL